MTPKKVLFWDYIYKDHLGNIRLSYADCDGNGTIDPATEILEENNYYPFGLKHQGYNNLPGDGYKYKYNGKEYEDSFGLNIYEMDLRQYDPAIGRWVVQDPVIHHDFSPYSAFDNNPVYWSDPSGANSVRYNWGSGDYDVLDKDGKWVGSFAPGMFEYYQSSPEEFLESFFSLEATTDDNGGGSDGNGNGGGGKRKKGVNKATASVGALVITAEMVEAAGAVGSISWLSVFGTALLLNGDTSPDRFAQFAKYGEVAGSWPWQHAASYDIVESINSRKNNSGYYMHYTSLQSAYAIWKSKTIRPGLSNVVYVTNAIMTPSEAYSILFQSQNSHSGRGEAVIIMKLHQYQEASLQNEIGGDVFELQHYGPLKPASIIYAGPNPFGN